MGRRILAVLAGLVAAFIIINIIEKVGHIVYPPPPDLNMNDTEAFKEYVKTLPLGAFLFVLAAQIVAAFVGGWLACYIAKDKPLVLAGIIGGLILVGTVINIIMIPHPVWFSIAGIAGVIAATYFAARVGAPNTPVVR